ncbi:MAG: HlyD family efflux transporter periplasmic adaptor subunit [Planctomycetales bacterium]
MTLEAPTDPNVAPLPVKPGIPGTRLVLLLLVALSIGTGVSAIRSWNRWETFHGSLQAKSRNLISGREARIARILIHPGDVVEKGTPLMELQDAGLEQRKLELNERLNVLKAQLEERQAQAEIELQKRKQTLESQIFEVQLRLAEAKKMPIHPGSESAGTEAPVSQTAFSSPKHPNKGGAYSFENWDAQAQQIKLCEDRLARLDQQLNQLPQEIRTACGVNVAQARVVQAQAQLTHLDKEQKTLTLVAESHGTVGVLQAQAGDVVIPQQPIVELLDEDQPYLIVKIPSEKLTEFSPGTQLKVVFPGQLELDGRVEAIPPQVAKEPASKEQKEHRVSAIVVPTGAVWPKVPFGAQLEVRRYH